MRQLFRSGKIVPAKFFRHQVGNSWRHRQSCARIQEHARVRLARMSSTVRAISFRTAQITSAFR